MEREAGRGHQSIEDPDRNLDWKQPPMDVAGRATGWSTGVLLRGLAGTMNGPGVFERPAPGPRAPTPLEAPAMPTDM